jgi:hypothetical protein
LVEELKEEKLSFKNLKNNWAPNYKKIVKAGY